ncbi:high mobility group nucleosome-binding domain-containing protein 5-like isoform X7 [Lepisosteus oculatus]|uniref:high mobility group nucleosome-binding domain-containing protein 5-like isoform X7 n=1 Tax=Lepisosteus oculatus TaxID=7918 RepID=UPI0035F52EF6
MRRSQSLHQLRPVQSSRAPGRTASLDSLLETGGPDLRPLDRSGTQEALVRTCFLSRTDRKAASLPPSQKSPCGVLPENCHNVLQRGDAAQKDFTGIKENESQDSNQEHSGLEQHQDSTSTVREALPILTYDLHRKTCLLERDNEELRKKSKVSHEKLLLEDQGTRVVKAWIKKNENNLAKLEATVDIETIQAVEKNILQNREKLQEALASLLPRQLCPEEMGEAKAQQFIRQYEEAYGSRRELDEEDEEEEAAVAEDKEHESHRKEEEDTEEKKQEGKGEGKEENKDVLGVEEEGEKEGEKEEEKKKGEEEEEKGEEEDTGEEEEENGEDKGEKGEEKEDTDEEEGEKQGEMMATDVTEVREEERGEEDQNG